MKGKCDNCEEEFLLPDDRIDLEKVDKLATRLYPGSEVPVGECPACGALCYLMDLKQTLRQRLADIQVVACNVTMQADEMLDRLDDEQLETTLMGVLGELIQKDEIDLARPLK